MLADRDRIFTNLYGREDVGLAGARVRGQWDGTKAILALGPETIIEEMKASGLRGRSGGGFLTGQKWSLMPKEVKERPHYLLINADESEPGTCKDREIMRHDPHLLVEGALIASFAIRAHAAYIYVRGEFTREREALERAIAEAYDAHLIGKNNIHGKDFDLFVHHGANTKDNNEETTQNKNQEGKMGLPRMRPPYPANSGVWGCPTTVNNVESIAVAPEILRRGASWFAHIGRTNNTGTKIFCISGHVNTPCTVEAEMGIPQRELIDTYAGGVRGGWDNLLAIVPGGSSFPAIPKSACETVLMDFDSLRSVGVVANPVAIIVMDMSADIVRATARFSKFYMHESCGQRTPCREGTGWMHRIVDRLAKGEGSEADIALLMDITAQVGGHTICGLGDAAAGPVRGLINNFRTIVEDRIAPAAMPEAA